MIRQFTNEPLLEVISWLKSELYKGVEKLEFEVLNPDYMRSAYAGKSIEIGGKSYLYRGYKAWNDLAELLFCRMRTPAPSQAHTVILSFEKLITEDSFHSSSEENKAEKYGVGSVFFEINKNEEPAFLWPYHQALKNVKVHNRKRVLDLGISGGNEFHLIKEIVEAEVFEKMDFVGIDHSASAIAFAKNRFPKENMRFIEQDINTLDQLNLGRFDLIISIGTFQSPGIDFKAFFMSLVQNYLSADGAIVLGFPNCRWMGGEMVYGAKVPNYSYSEMGMLYSDVIYCKKYLQQKKFRVTLTGKDYVFLTATKIGV